jgi:hypothetical protein
MVKLTVEVFIDEQTGMQAAAALRLAFLGSTVYVERYIIRAIKKIDETPAREDRYTLTGQGIEAVG